MTRTRQAKITQFVFNQTIKRCVADLNHVRLQNPGRRHEQCVTSICVKLDLFMGMEIEYVAEQFAEKCEQESLDLISLQVMRSVDHRWVVKISIADRVPKKEVSDEMSSMQGRH